MATHASDLHAARGQPVADPVRRALDNRQSHPILGDAIADQIVRTLDYDYRQLHIKTNLLLNATVQEAGRSPPGSWPATPTSGSTWVPGSTPDSSAWPRRPPWTGTTSTSPRSPPPARAWSRASQRTSSRRRAGPGLAGRRPQRPAGPDRGRWADGVPHKGRAGVAARPAHRHFPSGEMIFNSYTKFAVWAARHSPAPVGRQLIKFPGVDDPTTSSGGTPGSRWSRRSCSAGNPRSPSSHRPFAGTTGCKRAAPAGPGRAPSSLPLLKRCAVAHPVPPTFSSGPASTTRWPGRTVRNGHCTHPQAGRGDRHERTSATACPLPHPYPRPSTRSGRPGSTASPSPRPTTARPSWSARWSTRRRCSGCWPARPGVRPCCWSSI